MRKLSTFLLIMFFFNISCSYRGYIRWLKPKLSVQEVIAEKEKLDKTTNPAQKYMILKDLKETLMRLDNVVVKDITPSNNIDYEFCVVVEIPHKKGKVECHIYSKGLTEKEDIKTVARLKKGKSVIDAVGEFNRFFTLLDEVYTKIEIINSSISIVEE